MNKEKAAFHEAHLCHFCYKAEEAPRSVESSSQDNNLSKNHDSSSDRGKTTAQMRQSGKKEGSKWKETLSKNRQQPDDNNWKHYWLYSN